MMSVVCMLFVTDTFSSRWTSQSV